MVTTLQWISRPMYGVFVARGSGGARRDRNLCSRRSRDAGAISVAGPTLNGVKVHEDSRPAGVTDYQFNAADWKRLSSIERAHRSRLLASEALTMAEKAAPDLKERYLAVADELLRLALDLEAKAQILRG